MSDKSDKSAAESSWTWYWADPDSAAACVPQAEEIVQKLISGRWQEFGKEMPKASRVADLACGMGAAGRALLSGNPTADIIGADYAEISEDADLPFPVRAGVPLENLPFDDAEFDGAISQFGFEYAGEEASGELARILKPGGKIRLLMHHAQSVVVQANKVRRNLLEAISAFGATDAARSGDRARLQAGFGKLVGQYGEQPLILEIATACRDGFAMSEVDRTALLDGIDAGMQRELTILRELKQAAQSEDDINALIKRTASSIDWARPEVLEFDGKAICWELNGTRAEA